VCAPAFKRYSAFSVLVGGYSRLLNSQPLISARLFYMHKSEFPNILRHCEDITKFTPHVFHRLYWILRNLWTTLAIIRTSSHTMRTTSEDSIMSPHIARIHTFEYSILVAHTTQTTTGSSSSLHSPTYSYRTPVGIRESGRTGLGL
jgi:hypothetical protein